jgi:chromosome segregation ATPase
VRTVEVQVEEVGRELARLDAQVDEARTAADRAYTQYVSATKRIFRHYFGKLKESGERLGFGLEGTLRSRDDARFEVDLQVAIGDKAAVPYGSSSLSGGQKAALSILLAMTTLRLQGDTSSPPFFLVDEPFSASDVHKIQELGTFLDQTGAQYVVSMPSTSDLARCGPWLQAVLTCTQTRGGHDANGELRIAPPVKCSYVVRNGD